MDEREEAAIDHDFDLDDWEEDDEDDGEDVVAGEDVAGAEADTVPAEPSFRATIAGTRMTLLHWMNQMPAWGPTRAVVEGRGAEGVSVVDLFASGEWPDRELIVSFRAVGERRTAERVLTRWARVTGYRRIWFAERVEELEDLPTLARAHTRCNACAAPWCDEGPEFWRMVRACGYFPLMCPLCGGDLPQWTVRTRRSRAAAGRSAGARHRSVSPAHDTRTPR